MTTALSESEIRVLAHADALAALADMLRGPGCGDLTPVQAVELLRAAGWDDRQPMARQWSDLAAAVSAADRQAWSMEHHRLFEGATVCPLNQTAYVRRDKGVILADLCGFYQAFGLQPRSDCGEKPDHLVTEMEFLSLLLVMLAQAMGADNREQYQVVEDAARRFAADHMAEWLAAVADHLRCTSGLTLYAALADVLESTWSALAQCHGWPGLAVDAAIQPDVDTPMDECGSIADPAAPLTVAGRPLMPGSPLQQGH
ncbi:MAG: molecular chaperone TorD family protein [Phycisphaeraceae bacterium]|nr:molecular chaperone TorD family protein [Phycisphaeraceae bacterium]